MNIETLPPKKWLSNAENNKLNMLRCIHLTHNTPDWTVPRFMKNHLLIFVEHANILAEINGKISKLNAGDVIWVPPGVIRKTKAEFENIQEKDYRLHFNIGVGEKEAIFSGNNFILRNAWELLPLFQMLNEAYRNPLKYNDSFSHGICLALCSKYLSLMKLKGKRAFFNKQFNNFNSYIANNATRRISPGELAALVKLSPDYFSRKFKNDCELSPKEFIKRERIRFIANSLVESDMSIKEAACYFGYEDTSYFCRQFREVMKCSPMVHKKKNI